MRTSDGLVDARRIAGAATADARKLRRDSVVTAPLYPRQEVDGRRSLKNAAGPDGGGWPGPRVAFLGRGPGHAIDGCPLIAEPPYSLDASLALEVAFAFSSFLRGSPRPAFRPRKRPKNRRNPLERGAVSRPTVSEITGCG